MNLGAIILAAGYSSRMAGFKPLMTLGGATLLAHCARLFKVAGLQHIVVVTGHRGEEVGREASRLGLTTLSHPEYPRGMFSSVKKAVSHLGKVDGFFLLPVDTPLIYPATVSRLISCYDGRSVILPVFDGEQGHPPLIPSHLIPVILAHDGRGGLRTILNAQPCLEIPVWDRGVLLDADTADDFAILVRRFSRLGCGEPEEAMALASQVMPDKGVAHGCAVAGVAVALGARLNSRGCTLDLNRIHNGALLHDIGKGEPDHEVWGGELLKRLGLKGLAGIVAAHRSLPPPADGHLTEKEIVCLADKLVRGSRRMSVKARFAEKLTLYADDPEARAAVQRRMAEILALQELVEQQAGCTVAEMVGGEPPA
jgi:molybdenum cofactor cytidylyltransferase